MDRYQSEQLRTLMPGSERTFKRTSSVLVNILCHRTR